MTFFLFKRFRSTLSAVREYILRWLLGIPYVRSIEAGNANFKFLIANIEGYNGFGKPRDLAHMEGAATVYFMSYVKPGSVIVDVGAHHGFYTLLSASLLCGKGMVIAFESNRENYNILSKNIALNHFVNVHPRHAFVSDSSVGHHCKLDVELKGLKPTFIKIDVEGAEGQVLSGAKAVIDYARPAVMCELHPAMGADIAGIIKFFRERSYKLSVVREKNHMVIEDLLPSEQLINARSFLLAEPDESMGVS